MRRQLSEEGQRMFNNLKDYEDRFLKKEKKSPPPPPVPPAVILTEAEKELLFLRTELKRMIKNSELVITDCKANVAACTSMEEYMANEAKVALTCHENLLERLKRMLNGESAFSHKVLLDEELF